MGGMGSLRSWGLGSKSKYPKRTKRKLNHLISPCLKSKERELDLTSQWEECQNYFVIRAFWMLNIMMAIFGKYNQPDALEAKGGIAK